MRSDFMCNLIITACKLFTKIAMIMQVVHQNRGKTPCGTEIKLNYITVPGTAVYCV